jgi:hypothetical protein
MDAAVYAAVLDTLFTAQPSSGTRRISVNDSTTRYPRESMAPAFWEDFAAVTRDRALVRNFEKAVRDRHSLHPLEAALRQRLRTPIDLVNDTLWTQVQARAAALGRSPSSFPPRTDIYWLTYYEAFPRSFGKTRVSAVGYDSAVEYAIVYVEHSCHSLCGSGHIVLLHREPSRWRVVKLEMTWVS